MSNWSFIKFGWQISTRLPNSGAWRMAVEQESSGGAAVEQESSGGAGEQQWSRRAPVVEQESRGGAGERRWSSSGAGEQGWSRRAGVEQESGGGGEWWRRRAAGERGGGMHHAVLIHNSNQGCQGKVRENFWIWESQWKVREFCDECPRYFFSCDQAALRTLIFRLSHLFYTSYHPEIFRSYYHWQAWCPCKKVKGQGHRDHDPI